MKLTICGSIAFIDEMDEMRKQLEALGHEVRLPPVIVISPEGEKVPALDFYKRKKSTSSDDPEFWKSHTSRIKGHFDKVAWSDAVLILNYDKNDIANYVGPNTLMEMGLALHLDKKIFLLNPIPDISYKEELLGMRPEVIRGDLNLIR